MPVIPAQYLQILSDIPRHDKPVPLIGYLLIFFVLGVGGFSVVKAVWELLRRQKKGSAKNSNTENYFVYEGAALSFTNFEVTGILHKHFPYFNPLNPLLKAKFIQRLQRFMSLKTFIIPREETYKELPVLVAATATQLTFGLNDYELPWYRYIHIHPQEYFANDPHALRVLAGHVEGQTITVAWNHFLEGIKNEKDGSNVGLHELAHALYYQHVVVHNGAEKIFIEELGDVMEESEEIYQLRKKYNILFSEYAYKNMQEFWAESIEIFFEKPSAMEGHYPHLFATLKELLNQDPLNKTNPLTTGACLKL